MGYFTFKRFLLAMFIAFTCFSVSGNIFAQNCGDLHWVSTDNVQINAAHIFCGEIKNDKPKGFHSMAIADSAGEHAIKLPLKDINPLGGGLYDARVYFSNGTRKFSTFFPDSCDYKAVLKSVAYAFANIKGNAEPWGVYGASAPAKGSAGYCLLDDGNVFDIRMGLINNDSKVNTAFPKK